MENTRMLRTYASIDPRVKTLGYVVKEFAKRCDIGDASRGSLSSYAYILMLIYYLQQVQPPVVPVLQEIHDGTVSKIFHLKINFTSFSEIEFTNIEFFEKIREISASGFVKVHQTSYF